jgi:hypothetical protein
MLGEAAAPWQYLWSPNTGMTAMIDRLLGTWTLVSALREEIPLGARTDMFGESPRGFINYSQDGRMIALITRSDRKRPAGDRATPVEAEPALTRSAVTS